MDELSRNFVNRFQGGFPIVGRPYHSVASELGTNEDTLISMIQKMLDDGTLSRFGPLYDAVGMGGAVTLAALSAPESKFDRVAEQVNAMPEVAHNYRRDHELNMWFVIATETREGIKAVIDSIESLTGLKVYDFPKLQEFYLGLWLQLDDDGGVTTTSFDVSESRVNAKLEDIDRSIIKATQQGLPLQERPYLDIAGTVGCDEETVMLRLRQMLESGVARRIGAVPNHYRLGLGSNGMSVWSVPADRIVSLGKKIGQLDFVSHCYERPRHMPIWPYNLFAMVHGHSADEVNSKVAQIVDILGEDCEQHEVLFSSAILKKTGLRLVA